MVSDPKLSSRLKFETIQMFLDGFLAGTVHLDQALDASLELQQNVFGQTVVTGPSKLMIEFQRNTAPESIGAVLTTSTFETIC